MDSVVGLAHWPEAGIKVYSIVPAFVVFIAAGDQLPVMELIDIPGKVGAVLFWHNGPIGVSVGVVGKFTVTTIVAMLAHCPAVGLNVKVVLPAVAVLTSVGFHVPVIPLFDVPGSGGADAPTQRGAIWVSVGVVGSFIVTERLAGVAH